MTANQQKQLAAARRIEDAIRRLRALMVAAHEVGVECTMYIHNDCDIDFYWRADQDNPGTVATMRAEFAREVHP
ncbi:MAG TPA: hypothetical protein VHI13_16710 [Candidatus Kapabacteria bacterium]|nr:hypothetical protein [Candidatus Kapabacteria bacterium]